MRAMTSDDDENDDGITTSHVSLMDRRRLDAIHRERKERIPLNECTCSHKPRVVALDTRLNSRHMFGGKASEIPLSIRSVTEHKTAERSIIHYLIIYQKIKKKKRGKKKKRKKINR